MLTSENHYILQIDRCMGLEVRIYAVHASGGKIEIPNWEWFSTLEELLTSA